MDIVFVVLLGVVIILVLIVLFRKPNDNTVEIEKMAGEFRIMSERMARVEGEVDKLTPKISSEFRENRKEISDNLQGIQKTVDVRVKSLQDDNAKKLEEMRETVDEKLKSSVEKRFNESFKTISGQLTKVYEGLGEMKTLANGVGDLKKVMEGVKTRGIYGEVQLGSIIKDMMNESQYEENIATRPRSSERVEFAVKMPGGADDKPVYLPIDSKFPVENYSRLIAAYEAGEKDEIVKMSKALSDDVKTQAKKISTKYVSPPHTTGFGIMFVPTESLYAEILRIPGLADEVRQKYNITIVSPSTLPVVLSGLLMGFRTIAIEKRSSEVWATLGAVKTQFSKFGDLLAATKKKMIETANKIESAETTSRQIERKLKNVEELPEGDSEKLIGTIELE